MTDLSTLLERVRAATGADCELDYLIADATGTMNGRSAPVTSSLDAAVGLAERVLPGWEWDCGSEPGGRGWARVLPFEGLPVFRGQGATTALALVAAILSALIAKDA